MIVVSDASVLIGLSAIDRLIVLQALFGELLIPEAVYREIVRDGKGRPGEQQVRAAMWIRCRADTDLSLSADLQTKLDHGEAEAITLAVEVGADILLMDERRGRQLAKAHGLRPLGTVGVLLRARQVGLIGSLQADLDALMRVGFRVGQAIYHKALVEVGER